jgi:hypothetical protein
MDAGLVLVAVLRGGILTVAPLVAPKETLAGGGELLLLLTSGLSVDAMIRQTLNE